jgi:pyruvate dehydrogenase E1 component beta subunit
MTTTRYVDAIAGAISAEMSRDSDVIMLGEDVALGGPFGATKGLVEAHGEERVINTPISEASVMGLSIGAAVSGKRPVVEVMFIDFATLAMDQLANHGAKLHYMSGGLLKVPLTVRALQGAGGGFGAHHSQSLEAWFTHIPGLKVVAPSTPADAAGLLISAIRDDNPVLFLEHRGLYWKKGDVGDPLEPVEIGVSSTPRSGSDVTIVSHGKMVDSSLKAADALGDDGIDCEVIDLRTLSPLDTGAILESVAKTGRLVVAFEAVTSGGLASEITARVQEEAYGSLAGPIARVGAPFSPVPASVELEKHFIPGIEEISGAVRRLVS